MAKDFLLQQNKRSNLDEYKRAVNKYNEIVDDFYKHFVEYNQPCDYGNIVNILYYEKIYKSILLKLLKNDKYKVKQIESTKDGNYERFEIRIN